MYCCIRKMFNLRPGIDYKTIKHKSCKTKSSHNHCLNYKDGDKEGWK